MSHRKHGHRKQQYAAAEIGDPEHCALCALATQVGLPEIEVEEVLASDRYSHGVRAAEAQARAYGISGAPFFVIDGRYGISGAQPADVVLQALEGHGPRARR